MKKNTRSNAATATRDGLGATIRDEAKLLAAMEAAAEPFRTVRYTEANFTKEFGREMTVETPIGTVELDYGQFDKVMSKDRQGVFGLIKPTFQRPLFIVRGKDQWGNVREVFYKTFIDTKNNILYFVTVAKDDTGHLQMASAHERRPTQILKMVKGGTVTYQNSSLFPSGLLEGFSDTALNAAKPTLPSYRTLAFGFPFVLSHGTNMGRKNAKNNTPADGLEGPYRPVSGGKSFSVNVPDSMDANAHAAVKKIADAVGDMDEYVRKKLAYPTKKALHDALGAEQVDAVAMAIYNIEERRQGMVVGDQTGIGKGRIAAAVIRYGVEQGFRPVFITEKPNLFSDLYRDLSAIGSANLKPFIVNADDDKSRIKDEQGNVVHRAPSPADQKKVFEDAHEGFDGERLQAYDFIMCTYSQLSGNVEEKGASPKQAFLKEVSRNNVMVLDESHNASGASNRGKFLTDAVTASAGILFLSATFAKRPENMPIYAMKTSIADASVSYSKLIEVVEKGGVALQELISSQLVQEGQMVRRERTYEGVEVNYITLKEQSEAHRAIADNFTKVMGDIIQLQIEHISPIFKGMDAAMQEGRTENANKDMGVDSPYMFSRVFQIINQMLMAIKAVSVAERALYRLRQGKKVVIAFANTMGALLEKQIEHEGLRGEEGEQLDAGYGALLKAGLESVMRGTKTDYYGEKEKILLTRGDLTPEGRLEYDRIVAAIENISLGLSISPIDQIIVMLEKEGYRVGEVTGRKYAITDSRPGGLGRIESKQPAILTGKAYLRKRKKEAVNDLFRRFNDNQLDVLLINQSGSTGASAHAIPTQKVPANEVKQRCMIVLQPELDINTEVQKRGRINRTGQVIKPIYDYLTSDIPAEQRLMMMLQKKLKSLDANTSSNQKNSSGLLDVPDFLNKYGNEVIVGIIQEDHDGDRVYHKLLDDPLNLESNKQAPEDPALRVSGRVAMLPCTMQEEFYKTVFERYNELVEKEKAEGTYDLEMETIDLQAKPLLRYTVAGGKEPGQGSVFSQKTFIEECEVNNLTKPMTADEVKNLIESNRTGTTEQELETRIGRLNYCASHFAEKIGQAKKEAQERIGKGVGEAKGMATYKKMLEKGETDKARTWLDEKTASIQYEVESKLNDRVLGFNNKSRSVADFLQAMILGASVHIYVKDEEGEYTETGIVYKVVFDSEKPMRSHALVAMPSSVRSKKVKPGGARMALSRNDELKNWRKLTEEQSADRIKQFILTGNLLQSIAQYPGRVMNYTHINGSRKQGVLLPATTSDKFVESLAKGVKMTIPIVQGLPMIRALLLGQSMAFDPVTFIKQNYGTYRVYTPKSRQKFGEIFTDPDLMALTEEGKFEGVSDKMRASLGDGSLDAFVQVLQNKYKLTGEVDAPAFQEVDESEWEPVPVVETAPQAGHDKKLALARAKAKAARARLLLLGMEGQGLGSPEILRQEGFVFQIYHNDHEPPHVHVRKGGNMAKVGIKPVKVILNNGHPAKEIKKIVKIVSENQKTLLQKWQETR